ncbi:hypothetical protein JOF29_006276 [Kribbella aluminosa]|uniref:HNH nuclease domain-containing protein n=1 Tax=Kribbella aluminosa TaxID=416017 RepID=A0ABS4UUE2_9ACTN|nr:HNH endonuclease signature motif containing protein [Kribbella aluminosa]MBP2355166.1 hypothetical protein [Kribbella aluminosa]
MDVLDGRSVVSLSDGEVLPALDTVDATITYLEEVRLQLIARVEDTGQAQELGARDAVELVSKRHRRDRAEVWRDVRLAKALPKYNAIATALTNGIQLPTNPDTDTDTDPDTNTDTNTDAGEGNGAGEGSRTGEADGTVTPDTGDAAGTGNDARAGRPDGVPADGVPRGVPGVRGVGGVRLLRTAQAAAIVSELERVRPRVPVKDLDIVEEQFVALAAHLSPAELRAAARDVCDLLDSDGPEPEEHKAAARESLTLTSADRGVKFKGYLANDNAELLRAIVHAGARPHKTIDGEPDPRSHDKRQADALSTALTIAATTWDTNTATPPATPPTSTPPTPPGSAPPTPPTTPPASSPADVRASLPGSSPADPAGNAPTIPPATRPVGAPSNWPADVPTSPPGSSAASPRGAAPATGPAADVAPRGQTRTAGGSGRGAPVPGYGAKANITVTIDLQDLKAATADTIGHTVYSNGLSAATIRRLACDANILPIVLGSNSEPLDVGRSERLVTKPIRRALNTRDRGCVVCAAPPVMCDAHHLASWIDGGPTALNNLVLLCRRHHTDLHKGRWTITITHGQVHVARPTWANPPPLHQQPPQPPRPAGPTRPAGAAGSAGPAGASGASGASGRPAQPLGPSDVPGASPARPEASLNGSTQTSPPKADPWGEPFAAESPPRTTTPADVPWSEPAHATPALPRTALPESALPESALPETAPLEASSPGTALSGNAQPDSTLSETAQAETAQAETARAETVSSKTVVARERASRWRADAATYAEAARFAVWDGNPANDPSTGPPSFATT